LIDNVFTHSDLFECDEQTDGHVSKAHAKLCSFVHGEWHTQEKFMENIQGPQPETGQVPTYYIIVTITQ